MNRQELERLYQRLILQDVYPGDVCPTDEKLAAYAVASLSPQESARVSEHLQMCSDCRKMADQLGTACAWFSENKAQIFAGLIDKAIVQAVGPWQSCLSDDVLVQYIQRTIPDTEAGRDFTRSVETHLDGCDTCRRAVERLKAQLAQPWVLPLDDLVRRADNHVQAVLREIVVGLKSIASARGTFLAVHAMPGFRSQPARTVPAIMLDTEGKMIIDREGRPQTMAFSFIRAQLDRDGTAVLELAAANERAADAADGGLVLSAAIRYEHRQLVFPGERVPQDGHVIFIGHLVQGIAIPVLPPNAVHLTVRRVAPA
ncbi:MAG: zf-HC2 domain-containing protein [Sedimentisphaerales bacterium]|nr:zf-HC2 domain-containing protein [Sedimentisphaerales bacterium]